MSKGGSDGGGKLPGFTAMAAAAPAAAAALALTSYNDFRAN